MPEPSWLERLKQRKIIQWAVAYAAGAFVVFQLLDALSEPLSLTTTIQRGILTVVVVGFFITLVLAWYHGEKGRQRVSGPELLMVAALLVVAGVALSMVGTDEEAPQTVEATAPADSGDARPSLAVLPLENLSPNSQDAYFADGVHEDITTALARISSLSVRGRSSVEQYRDRESRAGIREMAAALGVDFLLEGSARIVGTMAKVTVQLIDGRLDEHVWEDEWEVEYVPDEAIRIQGEIAQEVADLLRTEMTPEEETRIASAPTQDSEAQRLYHQARYLWTQRSEPEMREAIQLFQEAIARDSNYAEAQAGLADALLMMGNWAWETPADAYPLAWSAAERALELDPSLPEAHAVLGGVDFWYNRDWTGAENHFLQALRLDPDHAYTRYWYSILLDGTGRHPEALAQVMWARELDPLAPEIARGVAWHFEATREHERAIDELLRLLEEHPDFGPAWNTLCGAYVGASRLDDALAACQKGELETRNWGGVAWIRALQGNRESAVQELDRSRSVEPPDRQHPLDHAAVLIALGDFDGALTLLDRARDEGWPNIQNLTFDFVYDPIRSDPRFVALLEELNLPIIEYQ